MGLRDFFSDFTRYTKDERDEDEQRYYKKAKIWVLLDLFLLIGYLAGQFFLIRGLFSGEWVLIVPGFFLLLLSGWLFSRPLTLSKVSGWLGGVLLSFLYIILFAIGTIVIIILAGVSLI